MRGKQATAPAGVAFAWASNKTWRWHTLCFVAGLGGLSCLDRPNDGATLTDDTEGEIVPDPSTESTDDETSSSSVTSGGSTGTTTGSSDETMHTESDTNTGSPRVLGLAAGQTNTCALISSGRMKCWGGNVYGQLGRGNKTSIGNMPGEMGAGLPFVDLPADLETTAVLAGDSICATNSQARPTCWGRNDFGQLGIGNANNFGDDLAEKPSDLAIVPLGPDRRVSDLAVGQGHACTAFEDGDLKCWGRNNYGQLGRGNTDSVGSRANQMGDFLMPINLGKYGGVKAVAVGSDHSCALTHDNTVVCWGRNGKGELGAGHTQTIGDNADEMGDALIAVNLGSVAIIDIVAGLQHTCTLDLEGQVRCWGLNGFGQLGASSTESIGDDSDDVLTRLPAVALPAKALQISSGDSHVCALLDDATVRCWGNNAVGRLGLGHTDDIGDNAGEMGKALAAVNLGPGRTPSSVHAGSLHTCVLTTTQEVYCWGYNGMGQLGIETKDTIGDQDGEMGAALQAARPL